MYFTANARTKLAVLSKSRCPPSIPSREPKSIGGGNESHFYISAVKRSWENLLYMSTTIFNIVGIGIFGSP